MKKAVSFFLLALFLFVFFCPVAAKTIAKVRPIKISRKIAKAKKPSRAELIQQARRLILLLNAAAPPKPELVAPPVTTTTVVVSQLSSEAKIDLRAVVALRCYERDGAGAVALRRKGTGVLISRFGHILTARHLVEPDWLASSRVEGLASTSGQPNNFHFDHCEVALPEPSHTPTITEIRTINPQLAPGFFLFSSHRYFTPADLDLSQGEEKLLDFALLKIDGSTTVAQLVSGTPAYAPDHFPFVKLSERLPPEQTEVVTFGYPAEPGLSAGSRFGEFYLKGSVEQVSRYGRGDQYFHQSPLVAELRADSGIFGGRSGSPIFYRGAVFALIFGTDPELLNKNYAVTTAAILETLRQQNQAAALGY